MSYRKENPQSSKSKIEPLWGVAVNIVEEHPYGEDGSEIKRGTHKFHGGAKVYIMGAFWALAAN